MKIVYISGAVLGNGTRVNARSVIAKNIEKAKKYAEAIAGENIGFFLPHVHNVELKEKTLEDCQHFYYRQDAEFLIRAADAVLFVPGWEESFGARLEKKIATELHLPMFFPEDPHDIEEIKKWNQEALEKTNEKREDIDWNKIIQIKSALARATVPAA